MKKFKRINILFIFFILILVNISLIIYINLPYDFVNRNYNLAKITNSNYIPKEYSCKNVFEEKNRNINDEELLTHSICLNEENEYSYEGFVNEDVFILTDSPGEYTFKVTPPLPIDEYETDEQLSDLESYKIRRIKSHSFFTGSNYLMEEDPYIINNCSNCRYDIGYGDLTAELEDFEETIYFLTTISDDPLSTSEYETNDNDISVGKYRSSTFSIEKKD